MRIRGRAHDSLGPAARRMPQGYERLTKLWTLRLLTRVGGHRNFLKEGHCEDDRTLEVLGITLQGRKYDRTEIREELFDLAARCERAMSRPPAAAALSVNLLWLEHQLGLLPVETDLLRFAILMDQHPTLFNAAMTVGHLNLYSCIDTLATVLDRPDTEVAEALQHDSALMETGILFIQESGTDYLPEKLRLIKGMADPMMVGHREPLEIFRGLFTPAQKSRLAETDYPHLVDFVQVMSAYLRACQTGVRKGVNILFHGAPGTGKTEFVRMLAEHLHLPLFEIASERGRGVPLEGEARLRAYHLAQSFFRRKGGALVLFDEAEDVFDPGENGKPLRNIKGWIHQTLEENPVPAIWVTNNLGGMDPAHVRRFDIIQEFKVPPRNVRARILDRYLGTLEVDEPTRALITEHSQIPPAWLERSAGVVAAAKGVDPSLAEGPHLTRLLAERLSGGGRAPLQAAPTSGDPRFRMECLRADCDLEQVQAGLLRSGRGRFCLYGPPGTGKSAFGRHLAQVLDRPLLVRRASDLLSKYVGEAEKNMARMFEEAQESRSVLLLDEADSFLRDRGGATRSWEVSHVNEMLTQMESFEGVFMASTNLMGDLDPASLRRFDLKIKFDFLAPAQGWQLFCDAIESLGLPLDSSLRTELERMSRLTPGDFATVWGRARIIPPGSARAFLRALDAECALKPHGQRRCIGF